MRSVLNVKLLGLLAATTGFMVWQALRHAFTPWMGWAGAISAVVIVLAGAVVGTGSFVMLRRAVDPGGARIVSAFVAGFFGAGVGFVLGYFVVWQIWLAIAVRPHPGSFNGDELVYRFVAFTTLIFTCGVSALFGLGIGIPIQEPEKAEGNKDTR